MSFTIQRILGIAPVIVLGLLLLTPAPGVAQVAKPDLVVSSLASPPGEARPGESFVVTASVKNNGPGPAGGSVTKFFLVPTTGLRKNLKGVQIVGALGLGASEAPQVTVTIYSDTTPGPYSLQACANRGETEVVETNATDVSNCRIAPGTIKVLDVPDLVMKTLTDPPPQVPQGKGFEAFYKVKNTGAEDAAASLVKFSLVPTVAGATGIDLKLAGDETVGPLAPGATFTNTRTVTVRAETLPGTYRMKACADYKKTVSESDENDNCFISAGMVQVTPQPDLVVDKVVVVGAVVGAPLTINQGETLPTIKVTVRNAGLLNAAGSTMKFRLASIGVTPPISKNLKGTLAVPAVPGGTIVKLTATPSVDEETIPGSYIVSACVDAEKTPAQPLGTVEESSESNNCTPAPGTLAVTGLQLSPADLAVTALTPPPATRFAGETFSLTATVKNSNSATAESPPTTSKFSLVNAPVNPTTIKNLKGIQSVGKIPVGASDATPVTVEVYGDTVQGIYYLQACADGGKQLHEIDEDDNCLISPSPIEVKPVPDLEMTAIGNPLPATVVAGQTFSPATTYTVTNVSAVRANLTSTAKFYLVSTVDATRIDLKGTVPTDLAVPALDPGEVFNWRAFLKVRADTPPGSYRLLGCADSGKVIDESDEDDNCKQSATTVQVEGLPDLSVIVKLGASLVPVQRGGTLPITVNVKNQGFANAAGSVVKLSLVVAPGTAAPIKTLLESPVPPVDLGLKETVVVTATIPQTGVPLGDYVVVACVDSAKVVAETTDENNCGTSAGIIRVQ